MNKISEVQQKEVRNLAKEKLIELEKLLDSNKEIISEFKEQFNICETTYKVVLKEHQFFTKGKRENEKDLKLTMTQVPYALNFAGYKFDKDLLSRLFGSNASDGKLTAKEIRNKLTHGIDQNALDELKNRKKELFNDMKLFIKLIRKA